MKPFRKLHGRLTPHGLELQVLRRLPVIALVGLLPPLALSALARFFPSEPGIDPGKHVLTVDIFAISVAITFLTAVFTIAIGCIVVYIMKGPAYVADSYPVACSDRPAAVESRDH